MPGTASSPRRPARAINSSTGSPKPCTASAAWRWARTRKRFSPAAASRRAWSNITTAISRLLMRIASHHDTPLSGPQGFGLLYTIVPDPPSRGTSVAGQVCLCGGDGRGMDGVVTTRLFPGSRGVGEVRAEEGIGDGQLPRAPGDFDGAGRRLRRRGDAALRGRL